MLIRLRQGDTAGSGNTACNNDWAECECDACGDPFSTEGNEDTDLCSDCRFVADNYVNALEEMNDALDARLEEEVAQCHGDCGLCEFSQNQMSCAFNMGLIGINEGALV